MNITYKIGLAVILLGMLTASYLFLNKDKVGVDHAAMNHHNEMTVRSEKDFIVGMIQHHQEAVDTAKLVLERGGSTLEIRNLAQAIIDAQTAEISTLQEWHQAWYGDLSRDEQSYTPMMRDLTKLNGATLDKVFLEDMILHHEGALQMASSVKPYVVHTEINTLVQAIETTQSAEIILMKDLLEDL
jgi:uncharacterized protein (DUF305 family)